MRFTILKPFGYLLFAVFVYSCKAPEHPPVFKAVENVRVSKLSTQGVHLTAQVKFYNPNDTGVRLTAISIDMIVDGKTLAHADQSSKLKIKAKSDFYVPLDVNIDLKQINTISSIFGILSGRSLDATFTGHLKLSKGGVAAKIPVNFNQRIKL